MTKLRRRQPPLPSLRFSPYAWAKLLYLRDRGETEIGGFGISDPDDPLLIVDVLLVKQRCTPVTVAFDDTAVADFFDRMVDAGYQPEQFARLWIHTHPGDCPLPSGIDEETFHRVFSRTDWSVMAIVAQNDETYVRLSFHVGPGGSLEIPVEIDFGEPFDGTDWEAWEREYAECVTAELAVHSEAPLQGEPFLRDDLPWWDDRLWETQPTTATTQEVKHESVA